MTVSGADDGSVKENILHHCVCVCENVCKFNKTATKKRKKKVFNRQRRNTIVVWQDVRNQTDPIRTFRKSTAELVDTTDTMDSQCGGEDETI